MKKHSLLRSVVFVAAGLTLTSALPIRVAADEDPIEVARTAMRADRRTTVAQAMQFTEAEAAKFWPLYDQYRADMGKVGDQLKGLITEYTQVYPNVSEGQGSAMLARLRVLEYRQIHVRDWYLRRLNFQIPSAKVLRFAQIESRLDLAQRLELAAAVPLVPIEGKIQGHTSSSVIVTKGVPGATVVQTHEITATVSAIDAANRRVTLLSKNGIMQTVKVGPDAVNFDQIRVGDRVKLRAAEELIVGMAGPGATLQGTAEMVSLAPKGAKPGGIVAETTQITARITAINRAKRTATVRFNDGSTHTFRVRSDVDLSQRKVGEQVVFRYTEAVALTVEKP